MLHKPSTGPIVPSRNAIRMLRNLAFAGSTVGSLCAISAVTYEMHRRVGVAERILENKRALQTSAPNYDATYAAKRLSRMMEAAESGQFMEMISFKETERQSCPLQARPADREYEQEDRLPDEFEVEPRAARFETPRTERQEGTAHPYARQKHTIDSPQSVRWASSFLARRQRIPYLQASSTTTSNEQEFPDGKSSAVSTSDLAAEISNLSTVQKIRQLIDADRPIEAAQLFLDTHPGHIQGLTADRRELAVELFYINCREENVFVARSLFYRLDEIDKVSKAMWSVLVVALAKRGCIESVATLYMQYRHKGPVPLDLLDVVIRCLIESRRLTTAKWVLLRNLKHDRECGLTGAYLDGLWRKTRSIELISGQLTKILSLLPRVGKWPTDKLFNPVLKAYVEFGRFPEAEAMVREMESRYHIPLSCRTKGLLVYAKALQCDWEGVEQGLQEMCDLGLNKDMHLFVRTFDRIFLEFMVVHPAAAIRDFILRSIDKFGLVPDRVLYKHMLNAIVEKGDTDMIASFTKLAEEQGWKHRVEKDELMEMVRAARFARDRTPAGFWQLLQAARMAYGQAATSQRILGFDKESVPFDAANQMPIRKTYLAWYERRLRETTPSRPVDQYQGLDQQMVHYIHVGKMNDALKCFENARNAKLRLKTVHLELAAIASLIEYGVPATQSFIDAEWRNIRDTTPFLPIFLQQIMEFTPEKESEVVKTAVFQFYKLLWKTVVFMMKHHITVSMTRRLLLENKPDIALDLLSDVYCSRYGRVRQFGGTEMKMFLRTFAQKDHLRGVRWCILSALARGTALNRDFVVEVRRILPTLGETDPDATVGAEHPLPTRAMKLEYLHRLADILERKCDGDPEVKEFRGKRHRKQHARRSRVKRPQGDVSVWAKSDMAAVWKTVTNWDEEIEFEALFERVDLGVQEAREKWVEGDVLTALGMEPGLHLTMPDDPDGLEPSGEDAQFDQR